MRQRRRSCLQRGPPMCHTTHLCHAEGGSDPLSRSPHYYSLAETDSTRLSVCSESFGLRKCIIGPGCQGDGTIRPQIKESPRRQLHAYLVTKPTPARLPLHHNIDPGNSNCFKLKSEWTDLSWEKSFVPVTLVEPTKSLKLQFDYFYFATKPIPLRLSTQGFTLFK